MNQNFGRMMLAELMFLQSIVLKRMKSPVKKIRSRLVTQFMKRMKSLAMNIRRLVTQLILLKRIVLKRMKSPVMNIRGRLVTQLMKRMESLAMNIMRLVPQLMKRIGLRKWILCSSVNIVKFGNTVNPL